MKRWYLVAIVIVIILFIGILFFKGKKGVAESEIEKASIEASQKTNEQSEAVLCALKLYKEAKDIGSNFSSQCLGNCGDYAVDIVHVPRDEIDNLAVNQCKDYREGKVKHFIELDNQGEIVRIE